jgi:hypothetical protein
MARLPNSQSAVKPARGGRKRSSQLVAALCECPSVDGSEIAATSARRGQSAEGLQAPGSGETPEPTVQSGWEKVRTETGLTSGCPST